MIERELAQKIMETEHVMKNQDQTAERTEGNAGRDA
jgi:hypothetical protein